MLFFNSQNTISQQQPVFVEIKDGLKAHWLLNGNAEDTSGNGWNGIIHGATPTTGRFNEPNGAMLFGEGDVIEIPNPSGFLNQAKISVSLWLYSTNIVESRFQALFSKHSSGRHIVITLDANLNNPKFHIHNNVFAGVSSSENVVLNKWTHIVATISDSNEASIYIDGELKGRNAMSDTPRFFSSNVSIGNFSSRGGSSYDFDGKITDVRVFDRVLTDSEITLLSQ